MAESRFVKPKEICGALKLPHPTLNGWQRNGMLSNLDAQKANTTPGATPPYTHEDYYAVAIVKAANEFDVLNRLIGSYARVAVDNYLTSGGAKVCYFIYRGAGDDEPSIEITYDAPRVDDYAMLLAFNTKTIIEIARQDLARWRAKSRLKVKYPKVAAPKKMKPAKAR
jgi:hypothetical protein